ncbi:unnamed protein product [Nezara viridula]|uniref:Uncharacterized protein n=1 Tax=Nezara viridula TaxID=85310 RepID=A0A9P0MP35_NEZVI|nr:unnamed protein product [Nezara viridula]
MAGGGRALKEAVPAALKLWKTMRRQQSRNRVAAKIIRKTHPESGPTIGHSAKDTKVIPDPAKKAEESDVLVSDSSTQVKIKEPRKPRVQGPNMSRPPRPNCLQQRLQEDTLPKWSRPLGHQLKTQRSLENLCLRLRRPVG